MVVLLKNFQSVSLIERVYLENYVIIFEIHAFNQGNTLFETAFFFTFYMLHGSMQENLLKN